MNRDIQFKLIPTHTKVLLEQFQNNASLDKINLDKITNFTNYLNKDKISFNPEQFPSISDLRYIVKHVEKIIQENPITLSYYEKRILAEFALSLELWDIEPNRDEITNNYSIHNFLIEYEKEYFDSDDED